MDLRTRSTVADFFIICAAGSGRQLGALKDHIEESLVQYGCPVRHTEGAVPASSPSEAFTRELQWVLMDYGEIVVHLMDHRTRTFYRLEDLWADAPRIPLSRRPTGHPLGS